MNKIIKKYFFRGILILEICFYWVMLKITVFLNSIKLCSRTMLFKFKYDEKLYELITLRRYAFELPDYWECIHYLEDECCDCFVCGYIGLDLAKKIK